jgi:hypothetical protein
MTAQRWQAALEAVPKIVRRSEQLAEQQDPDATIDAVDVLDRLQRCGTAEEQWSMLDTLGARDLRVLAWRMLTLLTAGRKNEDAIYELMSDPAWWDSYREVAGDARLSDATPPDVFRWALIHVRGGPLRYEQAVIKRA